MADYGWAGGTIFLQPGDIFPASRPARVKTVLGSCVAIVMRSPRLHLAAMAHCLLPTAGAPADSISRQDALRYVDTTVELMVRLFASKGVALAELECKLFGGADRMVDSVTGQGFFVGRRNVETARITLATRGLAVIASDCGGSRGRVLEFDTATGSVAVKMLPCEPSRAAGVRA